MSTKLDSRIPVTTETRKIVKRCKRGGESYDELLRKMVSQYNPDEAQNTDEDLVC